MIEYKRILRKSEVKHRILYANAKKLLKKH